MWDARNAESARARAREHWMRQQAREAATFDGVLRALSERGGPVTVWTDDGGSAVGEVAAVSAELVELRTAEAPHVWVVQARLAGVSPVSRGFDAGVASDDRGPTSNTTTAGLLATFAEERLEVSVRCGGVETAGRVAGAGIDVLTLRTATGELTYLPVAALSLLRLA